MKNPVNTSKYDPFNADFKKYLDAALQEFPSPGLAIAVVHGETTWAQGFGYADLATNAPVTPHTLFYAASTTKSFTAALVSKLVHQRQAIDSPRDLTWTTRLADVLGDDFVLPDEYVTKHVTFLDALTHRTGMPRHDMTWVNTAPTLKGITRALRHLPLQHEFRTAWEYCNNLYSAAAHAVETITGSEMATLLHDWLFAPLGMHETVYSLAAAQALAADPANEVNLARGYVQEDRTGRLIALAPESLPLSTGAGGIISNVLDYTKWIRLFLHPDSPVHNPSETLSPLAVKDMTFPHTPIPKIKFPGGNVSHYGLGLQTEHYRGVRIVGHDGGDPGFLTKMLWIPERGWGVVLMQNSYSLVVEPLARRLIDDFLDTPAGERVDVAQWLRDLRRKAEVRLAASRETLFPNAPARADVQPALPLHAYEGTYCHPAYHAITVSVRDPTKEEDDREDRAAAASPLRLYVSPGEGASLDQHTVLEHVNGEHWLAQFHMGPSTWLSDDAGRAKFEISSDGRVGRLGLQAETALEQLAWFERKRW